MEENYYPKKGEIIWCSLDPIKGHEQAGLRPCLVLSGDVFNLRTNLVVVCPLTSTKKADYYFRAAVKTSIIKGFVMVDQIRTLDWSRRLVRSAGVVPAAVLGEVYKKIQTLFGD
jgi:mRNA interferase MazF